MSGSRQKLRRSFARLRNPWRAALTLALVVAGAAIVVVFTRSTASGGGWDVSWLQCTSSASTEALPGSPTIGIVGVNDGRPYTTNPCLKSELDWAGNAAQVYLNTNNPGPGSAKWPTTTQAGPEKCVLTKSKGTTATPSCAYDYGWNAAVSAYTTLTSALTGRSKHPQSLEWWLDVESANTWLSSTTLNTASIDGMIAYLNAQRVEQRVLRTLSLECLREPLNRRWLKVEHGSLVHESSPRSGRSLHAIPFAPRRAGTSSSRRAREEAERRRILERALAGSSPLERFAQSGRDRSGDRATMRNLPVVAKDVSGTMPGTDPLRALLAKERRRERRRGNK